MPKGQITCYDYSLQLELFGKSEINILYLWLHAQKEQLLIEEVPARDSVADN